MERSAQVFNRRDATNDFVVLFFRGFKPVETHGYHRIIATGFFKPCDHGYFISGYPSSFRADNFAAGQAESVSCHQPHPGPKSEAPSK